MLKKQSMRIARQVKQNVLKFRTGDVLFVGIDVHKRKYHVALWKNGAPASHWVMPANNEAVVKRLQPVRRGIQRIVYEAGPTGYGLARTLEAAGFPVGVAAPGKTPAPANEGNKSDRIDCRKLAEFAAKGLLTFVAAPTPAEEHERQVLRLRESMIDKRRRVKQQIRSFFLQHELQEPKGMNYWAARAVATLNALELPADLRFCLDELLQELEHSTDALKRFDRKLAVIGARHEKRMQLLRTHPGVGEKTAMQFLLEVYRCERFADRQGLASYLGLAPRVRQSGATRREGGVVPAGRGRLRAHLVQACWQWIRRDAVGKKLYGRLCRNTGCAQKAILALARRMAVDLWAMARDGRPYCAAT